MDPLSAILIAMAVAGYFTKNVYQDSVFKARGQDPPSYRRQQERRARREGRTPVRQEARRFWVNAWEDAWESAEEARARAHAKKREKRRQWWVEDDIISAEDEAHERNREMDEAERPGDTVPDVPDVPDAPAEEPASEPAGPEDPKPGPLPEEPADDRGEDRRAPAWPVVDPDPTLEGATVFRPDVWNRPATPQEDPSMSTESHNLAAALAYTHDMATQSEAGIASTETSITGMTAGGVTGDVITAMHAAQEALAQAAVQFHRAHAELVNHIAVKEAYDANEGAGEKHYVTTE